LDAFLINCKNFTLSFGSIAVVLRSNITQHEYSNIIAIPPQYDRNTCTHFAQGKRIVSGGDGNLPDIKKGFGV